MLWRSLQISAVQFSSLPHSVSSKPLGNEGLFCLLSPDEPSPSQNPFLGEQPPPNFTATEHRRWIWVHPPPRMVGCCSGRAQGQKELLVLGLLHGPASPEVILLPARSGCGGIGRLWTPVWVFSDPFQPFTAVYSLAYSPMGRGVVSHGYIYHQALFPLGGHCHRLPVRFPQKDH